MLIFQPKHKREEKWGRKDEIKGQGMCGYGRRFRVR
jgi:hypothetical protein